MATFWGATFVKIGLHYTPTSGHTDRERGREAYEDNRMKQLVQLKNCFETQSEIHCRRDL